MTLVVQRVTALVADGATGRADLLDDTKAAAEAPEGPDLAWVVAGYLTISPCRDSVRRHLYSALMAKRPSRIDLLELDIDLRLADLWREAADIGEWNLEVVAAFMRAAYGKGYCDALTEDNPGSLCEEHGYRIPSRRTEPAREPS